MGSKILAHRSSSDIHNHPDLGQRVHGQGRREYVFEERGKDEVEFRSFNPPHVGWM